MEKYQACCTNSGQESCTCKPGCTCHCYGCHCK